MPNRRSHRTPPPTVVPRITQSRERPAPTHALPIRARHRTEAFDLALQTEVLLSLLTELAFRAFGRELGRGVGGLEFVDGLEEAFDFVAGLVEVVLEHLRGLVAALDLGLEVFDGAVDVADAAGFCGASFFE